jgi:hypothetical protein
MIYEEGGKRKFMNERVFYMERKNTIEKEFKEQP